MLGNNLRRALTGSNGDFSIFLTRPVSAVLLTAAVLWILVPVILKHVGRKVIVNEDQ
jgi:putative tricarboxylic transport membrane protein